MRAVVLAGGRGRRLDPLTLTVPKPLAPVGEVPILEIVLRQLRAAGFTEVTMTLGHLGELVDAYLTAHRDRFQGMELGRVYEVEPTGTAGSLALVPSLEETFLVMNGDILTTLDYRALVAHHRAAGAALTVAGTRQRVELESGVLHLDAQGRLCRYEEKPGLDFTVSMGIYVLEPEVLNELPAGSSGQPELIERLLAKGAPVACYVSDCLWLDIGTRRGLRLAQEVFRERRAELLPEGP